MNPRCNFCETPVDPTSPSTYRRVKGWEHKSPAASRRGGSDVVLRELADEFACFSCIERLRSGLSVEQGSLL